MLTPTYIIERNPGEGPDGPTAPTLMVPRNQLRPRMHRRRVSRIRLDLPVLRH